jgi:hypothetical protein
LVCNVELGVLFESIMYFWNWRNVVEVTKELGFNIISPAILRLEA